MQHDTPHPQPEQERVPLDALPGQRCTEALALLRWMRACPTHWFVLGSHSATVALDLARAGHLRLRPVRDGRVDLYHANLIGGRR